MILSILLASIVLAIYGPQDVQAQDFKMLCEKATSPVNINKMVQCYMVNVPPKILGIYDACIKMMSNEDFIGFLKLACGNEKILDKWIKCQAGKFKKEYTISPADEAMMSKLEPCIQAV